jgi:hypothetical protein
VRLAVLAVVMGFVLAPPALAQRAPRALDTHPFEATLWLDNDNLLLGGWSAMTNIEQDGNDFGRTHGAAIGVGWDVIPNRLTLRLDAITELFLAPLQAVPVYDYATIPTHFHELDRFRLSASWTGAELTSPWHASAGIGVDVSNRSDITFGATGQQRLWHQGARDLGNEILWQYVYLSDGTPIRVYVAFDGSIGATHVESFTSWLHLRFRSDAGMRLSTLLAASSVDADVEVALLLGDRDDLRAEIAIRERVDLWLDDGRASFHTTAELAAESAVLRLWMAVHWYSGDSRTAYWIYAFPNETMTFGGTVRL